MTIFTPYKCIHIYIAEPNVQGRYTYSAMEAKHPKTLKTTLSTPYKCIHIYIAEPNASGRYTYTAMED